MFTESAGPAGPGKRGRQYLLLCPIRDAMSVILNALFGKKFRLLLTAISQLHLTLLLSEVSAGIGICGPLLVAGVAQDRIVAHSHYCAQCFLPLARSLVLIPYSAYFLSS